MPLRITTVVFVAAELGLVEQFGHRRQEAVILGAGAVADPDVARAAERRAGANGDPALAEAGDDLALVGLTEVDPGEVGLGVGGGEIHLPQALLDVETLDDRRLD